MESGAYAVHRQLRLALENYIRSQYFGKSPLLLEAVGSKLDQEGILYQKPYIESSPAYMTEEQGITKSAVLPGWMKEYFQKLTEAHLGVYPSPFRHQISALEAAQQGEDLLVSTGTGSGKTECFIWPLLAKLAAEAKFSPESWSMRGIRTIIMYPMNALVSDQISRLRRLIGDPEHRFVQIFHDVCGESARRPQFGMYTGRTPYPGAQPDKKQDRKLADTYSRMLNEKDEAYRERLLHDGKLPAKENVSAFIEKLKSGIHTPEPGDAELVTRFEMQQYCPDILITNYSMLEYMLMRRVEDSFWNTTKRWLDADASHRLLFIIDEAHMYRGSAGGEVSYLIRRLLYRLGISRDRVQFILTTASMLNSSEGDHRAVMTFARELTAAEEGHSFCWITGEKKRQGQNAASKIDFSTFKKVSPSQFEGTEEERLKALNLFWEEMVERPFPDIQKAEQWMYEHLADYQPFQKLLKECQGEARSLTELAQSIFPGQEQEDALQAVSVLLAVAPFARSRDGSVLFPARMHMLFRGLKGIYACTNPECGHSHSDGALHLGEIYLSDGKWVCPVCGSTVYELYNDRRCGALFFKGYVRREDMEARRETYLWHQPGLVSEDAIREIHLFIPPDDFIPQRKKSGKKETQMYPCYLDVRSGFLYFKDDSMEGRPGMRKLYYCMYTAKGRPNIYTFFQCPHCLHQLSGTQLTSFRTKGNQSFFNLIKAQFQGEPAVPERMGQPDRFPNEGRKVLLFSDSRQRAAKLARDMSEASDMTAVRQTAALALGWMEKNENYTMDELYSFLAMTAAQRHIHLFYGEQQKQFLTDGREELERYAKRAKRHRPYEPGLTFSGKNNMDSMEEQLLRLYCGGYNTLTDAALSWIEPDIGCMEDALDDLEDQGLTVSEEEFLEIFNAWILWICDKYTALGHKISDSRRIAVRRAYEGYGLSKSWTFSTVIKAIMKWKDKGREENLWKECFNQFLQPGESGQLYIDMSRIRPRFDLNHTWYQCEQCSEITPYPLRSCCPVCGSREIHAMSENDLHALDFWREPVLAALHGEPVRIIDTEEHTAQLSHKDQRDELWARTEEYELRFQDFTQEGELPVDILSSTTTMEVGIDIGSLVAVGLRNIPPMRENYQQRAGRAGRRGASLSTIVTYCEDGPHDSLYFSHPEPMFRGDPRRPWIDIRSGKIIQRHLNMIAIQSYLRKGDGRLDRTAAMDFLQKESLKNFARYLESFVIDPKSGLVPYDARHILNTYKKELLVSLEHLAEKVERHPELFSAKGVNSAPKSLLDALYEDGIIPTYSFPKNVVSTYITDDQGQLAYQIERGLDVAIGEYAPGRSIVVDKTTYQIGGLYYPGSEWRGKSRLSPAKSFMEDPNYEKSMLFCDNCGWFGLKEDGFQACPFCGNEALQSMRPMLRPWGFAPKNGKPIEEAQLTEEYSAVQQPIYSTLPDANDVTEVVSCRNIRMAVRSNQRIIMLNRGVHGLGFAVCKDCGAAMPCTSEEAGCEKKALEGVQRPYFLRTGKVCLHHDIERVNLGYDFITDMLVLEFRLNPSLLDTSVGEGAWIGRAGLSLAEAVRLTACQEMDVEFTELVTGYRLRKAREGVFVDIYLYDSLSSGAGYAVGLEHSVAQILQKTDGLLAGCDCESACYKCLKHYYNQHIHGLLDRKAAKELLDWGRYEIRRPAIALEEQKSLLQPMEGIMKSFGISLELEQEEMYVRKGAKRLAVVVYPDMWKRPIDRNVIYLSDNMLCSAKPLALDVIRHSLAD